jgi:chromosome segregation ATPase
MTMTDAPSMNPTAPGSRLVTVDDVRYELQRERAITDAHFTRITSQVESLDQRMENLSPDMNRRFTEAREHNDQRFASIDARFAEAREHNDQRFTSIDARFAEAREHNDQRFDQVDARFDQVDAQFDRLETRFDALDERLRFNKTLIVASFSAVASVASVVVSLLK